MKSTDKTFELLSDNNKVLKKRELREKIYFHQKEITQ